MIFLAGRSWFIRVSWQCCLGACLASAIMFLTGCAATVPNMIGLTQAEATTAITEARLKVGTVAQQTSATAPSGNVISQNPASGSSVAQGSPVNLVLSSGPQMATVPNVVGLTQAAATAA